MVAIYVRDISGCRMVEYLAELKVDYLGEWGEHERGNVLGPEQGARGAEIVHVSAGIILQSCTFSLTHWVNGSRISTIGTCLSSKIYGGSASLNSFIVMYFPDILLSPPKILDRSLIT